MKSRPKHYLVGLLLIFIGCLLLGSLLLADKLFPPPDLFFSWLGQALSSVIIIGVASYFLLQGSKWLKRDAKTLLDGDIRPPIIYLRSFQDEKIGAPLDRVFNVKELYLARILRSLGPVVAVGQPGEVLPNLGAARIYYQDTDWQQGVSKLVAESRFVVLRAGATGGLLWELEHIIKNCNPTKILLFFPDGEDGGVYQEFKKRADDILPIALPSSLDAPRAVNFIRFDSDWKPINLQPWYWRDAKGRRFPNAARSLHYYFDMLIAIKPFLSAHGDLPPRIMMSLFLVYLGVFARIAALSTLIFVALVYWW